MISDSLGPVSRPFPLHKVTPAGVDATVEASESERAALARGLAREPLAQFFSESWTASHMSFGNMAFNSGSCSRSGKATVWG